MKTPSENPARRSAEPGVGFTLKTPRDSPRDCAGPDLPIHVAILTGGMLMFPLPRSSGQRLFQTPFPFSVATRIFVRCHAAHIEVAVRRGRLS